MALAMDFLVRAEEVVLISVSEDGPHHPSNNDLAEYLEWHGVRSQNMAVEGSRHTAVPLVVKHVPDSGADMLVMGAYTRDRVQRVIFGNVRGEVLDHLPAPVLMVD